MSTKTFAFAATLALLSLVPRASHSAELFAGEFMALGVSPAAIGQGGAVVASTHGVEAAYWNPAGLPINTGDALAFEHTEQFGGIVNHDALSFVSPTRGAAVAVLLQRTAVDGIIRTDTTALADPTQPLNYENLPDPDKTTTFSNTDYVFSLSYGRTFAEGFRAGLTLKIISRTISRTDALGYGFDLGAQYDATERISLGLMFRDVTTTTVNWANDHSDVVSPTIQPAVTLRPAMPVRDLSLAISLGAVLGSKDEGYGGYLPWHAVSRESPISVGAELAWRNMLFLRIGSRDARGVLDTGESRLTAGAGFRLPTPWGTDSSTIGLDVAWMKHTLGNTFRLGAVLGL